MLILLAQSLPPAAEEATGLAERLTKGGVPVIALTAAIIATMGAVYLFQKLLAKSAEFQELERGYRKTIEDKAAADRADYEKRLVDAKGEAKDRAVEVDKLQRERFAAEKESDATLAQAIRVLDANTKTLDRVERLIDGRKT